MGSKRASPAKGANTLVRDGQDARSQSPRKGSAQAQDSPSKRQRTAKVQECRHVEFCSVDFIDQYRRALDAFKSGPSACLTCGRVEDGVELYLCLQCCTVGCLGADQLHLKEHFDTIKGHFIAVDPRTGILFCWQCQQFVWNSMLEFLRRDHLQSVGPGTPSDRIVAFSKDQTIKRHCVALRGLYNLGKTCFMGCVLQALLHNPSLYAFFMGIGHDTRSCKRTHPESSGSTASQPQLKKKHQMDPSAVCIACEMDALFVEMYSGLKTPHAPTRLLNALWLSFKHLAGYEQQDAHEFLVSILYKLHEHLGGKTFGCDCVIHRTFSGVLQSSVTCCGCGATSPVFDPFMDIALDVMPGPDTRQLKLQDCFDRFCQAETLPPGSYVCAACNSTYNEALKQLSIKKAPATLCIQLKRFASVPGTQAPEEIGSQSAKLMNHVAFPEVLSIYPYLSDTLDSPPIGQDPVLGPSLSEPQSYADTNMYGLAAVIHHIGDMDSSGHYVAYIRHHGSWFKADDETMCVVSSKKVYACNAYMLFYQRFK